MRKRLKHVNKERLRLNECEDILKHHTSHPSGLRLLLLLPLVILQHLPVKERYRRNRLWSGTIIIQTQIHRYRWILIINNRYNACKRQIYQTATVIIMKVFCERAERFSQGEHSLLTFCISFIENFCFTSW